MLENIYKGEILEQKTYTCRDYSFIPSYCTMTVTTRRLKSGKLTKTLEAQSRIHVRKEIQALNCWSVSFSDDEVIIDGMSLISGYR